MPYRLIDPDVITEILHLLRTTNLSCRQIASETGVTRGVVDRQHARELSATPRHKTKLYRRCGCGAMSRPIGKNACLTCEIRRRQRQGTPADDDSLALDLADEHRKAYLAMRIRAKARHEARDKNPKRGSLSTNL